jgi:diguanylate cyclase (GGDEF)-like protein
MHTYETDSPGSPANRDPLTGLPTCGLLAELLTMAIPLARSRSAELAVLSIELDGFDQVCRTLGQKAADELLRQAAGRLQACLREQDIVARRDGGGFIAVLQGIAHEAEAGHVAQKLIEALSHPLDLAGLAANAGADIGLAIFPGDGTDAVTLLRNAEFAMHQARAAGRPGPGFFDPAMHHDFLASRALESDLQRALENREFVLHYQPVLRLPRQSLAGVEALIRWNHPEHGLIGPEVFLPAAEESGLMQKIGRWVITEACRQAAVWTREGRKKAVSVNISGRQIPEGIPVDWLRETLVRFSIDPGALTFDITEKALLQESPALRQWLTAVDEMQIRLALDDFGSGYAAISRLRHSGIHQIKIDSSLVSAMQGDLHARSLVKSIIDTGRNMGLQVTAEGVENAATLAALQAMGCASAQGFHLAPPMPAGQLPAYGAGNETQQLRAARLWDLDPEIACALI